MPDFHAEAGSAPAALAAFLRGVERRGALFAELQCGDAERGDVALATAMRAFRQQATDLPMADWPRRFWQRLAMEPALRQPGGGHWPAPLAHLGTIAASDRMALLSRLAAGLPEDEAVEVLGQDQIHYRAALAAACPIDPDGQPDALAWRQLADAIQQRMRELPQARLDRLARLREGALSATAPAPLPSRPARPVDEAAPAPRPATAARASRRGWPRYAVGAVVLLCVAGIAATYLLPHWAAREDDMPGQAPGGPGLGLAEEPRISVETLPAAEPAQTVVPERAPALHPDLDLLRDPESATLAQHADFYAWYLAGQSVPAAPADAPADAEPAALQEEGRDTTF